MMREIEVKGNKLCCLRPYKPEVAGSIPVPPTIRVAKGDAILGAVTQIDSILRRARHELKRQMISTHHDSA